MRTVENRWDTSIVNWPESRLLLATTDPAVKLNEMSSRTNHVVPGYAKET